MKTKHIFAAICIAAVSGASFTTPRADDGTGNIACPIESSDVQSCTITGAVLPDLMTVVPQHLGIQNKQQAEILRFSNGLANLGQGPWWLQQGDPDPNDTATCQASSPTMSQYPLSKHHRRPDPEPYGRGSEAVTDLTGSERPQEDG